jgi:hypothetical protein
MLRDPKHAQWVRGYYGLLDAMRVYVKEYHTTGLVWNPKVGPTFYSFVMSVMKALPRVYQLHNTNRVLQLVGLRLLHRRHQLPFNPPAQKPLQEALQPFLLN